MGGTVERDNVYAWVGFSDPIPVIRVESARANFCFSRTHISADATHYYALPCNFRTDTKLGVLKKIICFSHVGVVMTNFRIWLVPIVTVQSPIFWALVVSVVASAPPKPCANLKWCYNTLKTNVIQFLLESEPVVLLFRQCHLKFAQDRKWCQVSTPRAQKAAQDSTYWAANRDKEWGRLVNAIQQLFDWSVTPRNEKNHFPTVTTTWQYRPLVVLNAHSGNKVRRNAGLILNNESV